jgi:hypothetical protein
MRCFRATVVRCSRIHRNIFVTKFCYSISNIHLDLSNVRKHEEPVTRTPEVPNVHAQYARDLLLAGDNELDTQRILSPSEIMISLAADKRLKNIHDYGSVKLGFQRYKELYGNLIVPYMFRIPFDNALWPQEIHGMKLGVIASKLRRGRYYQSLRDELAVMGIKIERQKKAFDTEILIISLLRFKEIYGTILVPYSFCVPESETWPEKTRGMKLGVVASTIRRGKAYRHIRDELVSIGFNYEFQRRHHGKKLIMTALQRYKELFGDLLVPTLYRIPVDSKTEDWPKETWDMSLGSIVGSIRGGDCHLALREELEEMGFDYTSQKVEYGDDAVRLSLNTYKKYYENLHVPQGFTVPCTDMWPRETWDMKLGLVVKNIRIGRSYTSMRDELLALGLDYSMHHRYYGKDLVIMALKRYKEIYGDMHVRVGYRIPSICLNNEWPDEVWGMRLGTVVSSIRAGKSFMSYREEFAKVGFDLRKQKIHYGVSAVLAALKRYLELFGDFFVPIKFCIPSDTDLWPRETWGMKLGVVKRNVRSGRSFSMQKEGLSALGFQFRNYDKHNDERPVKPEAVRLKRSREIGPRIRVAVIDSQASKDNLELKRLRRQARADAKRDKVDAT